MIDHITSFFETKHVGGNRYYCPSLRPFSYVIIP